MNKEFLHKPEMKLVGISVRTNNNNEMDPEKAKISPLLMQFWSENVSGQIKDTLNPELIYAVYTEYESDEHGAYTYFLGKEVSSFDDVSDNLKALEISASQYCKLTTQTGKMPEILTQAWKTIWTMSSDDFGGKRTYQADFEIYDMNTFDMNNASLDIYIGIR